MSKEKVKSRLHPRNKNRDRYDLSALMIALPELATYVKPNKYGDDSIDFSDPKAVKMLNKALLNHYYGIKYWEFPDENLTPPIPGRADYIHHMADLLAENNFGMIPDGNKITCFDIGLGASCIYPLIGVSEYGWNFIGSDVDEESIASAINILDNNPSIKDRVDCRHQEDKNSVFYGLIDRSEKVDVTVCNPPFHATPQEAKKGSKRKIKNLTGKEVKTPVLNFAGRPSELIYEGGESRFILNMIGESKKFAKNCYLFSTLVSKQSNLRGVYRELDKFEATLVKTIPMGTGNKSSRIVAWSFLSPNDQKKWRDTRWEGKYDTEEE